MSEVDTIRDLAQKTLMVRTPTNGCDNSLWDRAQRLNKIIAERQSSFTKMFEAMILSDARNLDDMGVTGIFNEFRRYAPKGGVVCDALQSWKAKIDYRYWQA